MSGQMMTTHQVADLCEVDEKTVRRWIAKASDKMSGLSDKMSEAEATKRPVHWHLNEVLAIINAGGKHTMAALLAENAKEPVRNAKPVRLPAGVQLHELRLIYGPEEARKRIDLIIGYPPAPRAVPAQIEAPASEAVAEVAFAKIKGLVSPTPGLPPGALKKAEGASKAAFNRVLESQKAKAAADAIQPRLMPASGKPGDKFEWVELGQPAPRRGD